MLTAPPCGYVTSLTFLVTNTYQLLVLVTFLLALQFIVIETTGKKVLLFRGYIGMATALGLLTITLYLQVSHHHHTAWSALIHLQPARVTDVVIVTETFILACHAL